MISARRKSLRLFVAIAMPSPLAEQLTWLRGGIEGARWEPADNMHLTLRFVGDVDGGVLSRLEAALATVKRAPFELGLRGAGHFPPRGEPRSLWLGVESSPPLFALAAAVERAVRSIELPADTRKFSPHVTLARLRGAPSRKVAAWLAMHGSWAAAPFTVDAFELVQSVRGPRGSVYTQLARYSLDESA